MYSCPYGQLKASPRKRAGKWRYGWRWFFRFTPQPFYPRGNSLRCTLDRRLSVSGVSAGEKRQIPASTGIRTQISRSSSIYDRAFDWKHSNQAEWFQVVWAGDVGWLFNVTRDWWGSACLSTVMTGKTRYITRWCKMFVFNFQKQLTTLFLYKGKHLHSQQKVRSCFRNRSSERLVATKRSKNRRLLLSFFFISATWRLC
jgi:hypothetical protein